MNQILEQNNESENGARKKKQSSHKNKFLSQTLSPSLAEDLFSLWYVHLVYSHSPPMFFFNQQSQHCWLFDFTHWINFFPSFFILIPITISKCWWFAHISSIYTRIFNYTSTTIRYGNNIQHSHLFPFLFLLITSNAPSIAHHQIPLFIFLP